MDEVENWHKCNLCGDPYRESELVLNKDFGCICKGCSKNMKERDDEEEESEMMEREERKSKAGLFDEEP